MLSVLQINLLCQDFFILLHLTYIWTRISVWLRSHTQIQVMDFFPLAIVVATTTRILQWTLSVIEQLTFFNFFYCLLTDLYVRKYCYIVYRLFVFVLKASKITFRFSPLPSPGTLWPCQSLGQCRLWRTKGEELVAEFKDVLVNEYTEVTIETAERSSVIRHIVALDCRLGLTYAQAS